MKANHSKAAKKSILPSRRRAAKKRRRSLAALQRVRQTAHCQRHFFFCFDGMHPLTLLSSCLLLILISKVRASSYDVMLHRDSRFWEVIAKRNEVHAKDEVVNQDPMYGPTVGRRREFGTAKTSDEGQKAESSALQTFSIGNEFDFLPADDPKPAPTIKAAAAPPKKDTLMDALIGALDEDGGTDETETIVFHSASGDDEKQKSSSAPPSMGVPPSEKKQDTAPSADSSDPKPKEPIPTSGGTEGTTGDTEENSDDNDMDTLLADANMNLDDDMDNLLAGVGDGDFMDDDMDADLEDLENFLSQK